MFIFVKTRESDRCSPGVITFAASLPMLKCLATDVMRIQIDITRATAWLVTPSPILGWGSPLSIMYWKTLSILPILF